MEPKIREHIESLFSSAPNTRQTHELKEEIITNTIERYHDSLNEGKTQSEAYTLAIAGIGDINELLVELGGEEIRNEPYTAEQLGAINSRKTMFKGIAVALYILCFTPMIILSDTVLENISPAFMFFMISTATGLLIYSAKTKCIDLESNQTIAANIRKSAVMKAVAVGLFISCVTPCIVFAGAGILADISPVFMFMMIAAGVLILVFSKGENQEIKREIPDIPKKKTSGIYKMLVAILWVVVSFAFIFLVLLNPYTVTFDWLVFPFAAALQGLMRALFDYAEVKE